MLKVVLSNPSRPELGVATIPLPIPVAEYDKCIELLEELEIGDPIHQDCCVDEIYGTWPSLKRLEETQVNVDELDYLAKRLDSFDTGEAAQFQAMTEKLDLHSITDLINLTFCCQQATVITNFSDLESIGRDHYMNLHSGYASAEELEALDGYETALLLLGSGAGIITPYGVVYDNGMKLEQVYDGLHFPEYQHQVSQMVLEVPIVDENSGKSVSTWLCLPMPELQIDRLLQRSCLLCHDAAYLISENMLPPKVASIVDRPDDNLMELNAMCMAISKLNNSELKKLEAVTEMAHPEHPFQVRHLAENLDQFNLAPDVHTPAEYGKYMIQESGYFEYDPNLEEFYDYEKYGLQRMEQESGLFTDRGYVSYHGALSLDELMMEEPSEQGLHMGGMA